jgi:hypothetical protein
MLKKLITLTAVDTSSLKAIVIAFLYFALAAWGAWALISDLLLSELLVAH